MPPPPIHPNAQDGQIATFTTESTTVGRDGLVVTTSIGYDNSERLGGLVATIVGYVASPRDWMETTARGGDCSITR